MKLIIDLKTGNFRVIEMRDGEPHKTGIAAGDVELAKELGIVKETEAAWTDKMKTDFIDRKVEDAEKSARSYARKIAYQAAKVSAKETEELALQKRIDDSVAKALASQ